MLSAGGVFPYRIFGLAVKLSITPLTFPCASCVHAAEYDVDFAVYQVKPSLAQEKTRILQVLEVRR